MAEDSLLSMRQTFALSLTRPYVQILVVDEDVVAPPIMGSVDPESGGGGAVTTTGSTH